MRVAVVDIGTNSTRLLMAEVSDDDAVRQLERRTSITRLGAGVDADARLRQDAMDRVYATLDEYHAEIERRGGVDRAVAVLTSAVRDAANGAEFARTVQTRYGFTPHILSGDEEAQLTFLGATSERDPADPTRTLVVDVGGGSTELVIGSGRQTSFHVSTQAGVVRQTERHIHTDPPAPAELDELAANVRAILEQAVPAPQRATVRHAIGVAGTATSLASIAQQLEPYDPDRVQGYLISRAECEQILHRLAGLTLAQRRAVPGLHPDRAPTVVAGAVILVEVLRLFGLHELEVSEHDILRGAALEFSRSASPSPAAD